MNKHKLFMILWLAATAAIIISMVCPWWYCVEEVQEQPNVDNYRSEWTLTAVSTEYEGDSRADDKWSESYNPDSRVPQRVAEVWLRTFFLVLLGLALNCAVLWIYLRYRQLKTTKEWTVTILSLAIIVNVIVPLLFMFGLPVAWDDEPYTLYTIEAEDVYTSFWGETSRSELEGVIVRNYEWGPSYGWMIYWAAFILDVFILLLIVPPARPTVADRDQKDQKSKTEKTKATKVGAKF
jgi:hypothetical protein